MNKNPTNKRIIALVRERDEALALLYFAKKANEILVDKFNELKEENVKLRPPAEDVITAILEDDRAVLEELAKED